MQSILQYRRFKRHLQHQIQNHGLEKVAGCEDNEEQSPLQQDSEKKEPHRPLPDTAPPDAGLEEKELENTSPTSSGSTQETLGPAEDTEVRDYVGKNDDPISPTSSSDDEEPTHTVSKKSSRASSLRRYGTRLGQQMTGVSIHSQKTEGGTQKGHVFVVGYQGPDDMLDPHNWSVLKRISITILVAQIGLIVGFASSVDSAALPQAMEEFGVSEVVESLATALYLAGFGFGAFTAAPLSETFGRNPIYLGTGTVFMIFIMASGLSPNIGAQLAFRFLAGFFGSTPLTCAGGTISDMWTASERTAVFPVFANSAFWGPILGPIIGGFIGQSSLVSWRWCEWVTLIWSGLIFGTVFFFMPETYGPVLLKWKAEHLRKLTGDDRYMSALEVQDTKLWDRVLHNLGRPWLLFAYEPIAVLFTLYLSVVYIVLFTFLTGFEFIFEETYGLSQGLTFLIFVAIGIGLGFASAWVPFVYKRYKRNEARAIEQGKTGLAPEQRLIFAMMGAPFLPIGLFWMGWTAYPSISVWSPVISCVPVGFAIMGIFISTYQYLIDSYEKYAASALVGCTFVRYIVSGGMIPVSIPFYKNLGVHWTLTVLGAIAVVMTPVPYLFYIYGPAVRKKSRYAVGAERRA